MGQYSIVFDGDYRYFIVVKWDDPIKKVTGIVVFRSHTELEARDWVLATLDEETRDIYNEFG